MIRFVLILPTVMIVLAIGASALYLCAGNWRMGMYWAAAAALNICVTF